MRKIVVSMLVVLLMAVSGCASIKKIKAERRPRRRQSYYQAMENKSDISYYRERSPGAERVGQQGALIRSLAGQAVDGKLMRVQDENQHDGSLWTPGSKQNFFFASMHAKDIGDIIYINLKEDIRSMLRRGRRGYTGDAYRRALAARKRRLNTKKAAISKKSAGKPPSGIAVKKPVKKKASKRLKKNTYIAARVIDKLPNGTLLIEGHKLIDVNSKLREILISGYVKENDLSSRGEVDSRKMADLTIDYIVVNKK